MSRPTSDLQSTEEALDRPLEGVRVVEVAGGVPAAYCTHLLAGYGAEVVRVEGADTPTWTLSADEATYLLAGKTPVVVDHEAELARLVPRADLVVVDGRPGRFDVAGWRAANPALVAVTISPYGQTGPDRHQPADDLIAFAAGGMMSLTGDPAATPLLTGGAQALYFGGLHAFSAALGAYYGAVVHGEGDWVDLSLQECMAGALELYGPASAHGEPAAVRFGNYHRAVWALYPCADGYAGVFCLERQVPALFKVVGDEVGEDLLGAARFRDPLQRPANDEELSAYVLSYLIERTGDQLAEVGAAHKIPFGKVRTPAELLHSPALEERRFFDEVITEGGETVRVPGRPFVGLGWHGGGPRPAPVTVDAMLSAWSER